MTPLLRTFLGVTAGAVLGYVWYRLVGCRTGTCPLTATPLRTILYGAFMGLLATWPSGRA